MKVLLITQYFPPETGAAASRWGDYTRILADQNYKITVLCEAPHYPKKSYYPGYKNKFFFAEKTKKSNLKIIRTKAFASGSSSRIPVDIFVLL